MFGFGKKEAPEGMVPHPVNPALGIVSEARAKEILDQKAEIEASGGTYTGEVTLGKDRGVRDSAEQDALNKAPMDEKLEA